MGVWKRVIRLTRGIAELKGSATRVIVDPPFLSEDCQTKGMFASSLEVYWSWVDTDERAAAMTVRWLSKAWGTSPPQDNNRLMVCTGERMENLIITLYRPQGVLNTTFEPIHSKGLSNEFFCYANFECKEWKWRSSL
jgi:hypothetical protein